MEAATQRQNFASTATIRAAIFDVMDAGFKHRSWIFNPDDESDDQSEERHAFANAVVTMIEDLQTVPFNHVKLENLCPRHKIAALPSPTAQFCAPCQAERKEQQ